MGSSRIGIARLLRRRPTNAEAVLWRHLRAKRFEGLKFRRQQPIGAYIVDFVCFERRLVIEVDGGAHALEEIKDRKRDSSLRGEGFRVLRFWNNDVFQNIDGVLETIRRYLFKHPPLTPPIKGGGVV